MSDTLPVTRHRTTGAVPGTDLFFHCRDVVNMPGVKYLWVGRLVPGLPGNPPQFDCYEELWLYEGREYFDVEQVIAAVAFADGQRAVRDRMGETLRRLIHGLIRPLWADMPDHERESWRAKADATMRLMSSFNLAVTLQETGNGK
jgi:hypothetical protein